MQAGCLAVWLLLDCAVQYPGMRSPHSKASTIPKRAHKGLTSDVTLDILWKSDIGEKPWSTVTKNSPIPQNFWQVRFKLKKKLLSLYPPLF
jgi:hypothetical protein